MIIHQPLINGETRTDVTIAVSDTKILMHTKKWSAVVTPDGEIKIESKNEQRKKVREIRNKVREFGISSLTTEERGVFRGYLG